jgi:hypothetical protein
MYIPASNRVNIMEQLEIEIGDTVRIALTSGYYNSYFKSNPKCNGIVSSICSYIDVDWENNTSNTYQSSDLILIKKGKAMQDHLIDPDCDDLMTSATAHHWAEIHKHGETTFHSDEEIRDISNDLVMREVLDELDDKGLYEFINFKSQNLIIEMHHTFESKLKSKMQEALHDYYS